MGKRLSAQGGPWRGQRLISMLRKPSGCCEKNDLTGKARAAGGYGGGQARSGGGLDFGGGSGDRVDGFEMHFEGKATRPFRGIACGAEKMEGFKDNTRILEHKTGDGGAIYWTRRPRGERRAQDQGYSGTCWV